jgi:hypothetical protein
MIRFFVYGSIVLSLAVVVGTVVAELRDWLVGRREKNLCNRAIRLQDHHYTFPLSEEQHEELEDWAVMVDMSDDERWIADGIELLSMHATFCQKLGDDLEAA